MKTLSQVLSFTLAMCVLACSPGQAGISVTGDSVGPTDNVYFPGYVDVDQMELDPFLPESLRAACKALRSNDLTLARSDFSAYIRRHPDDLAPYVGYLQAMRGRRDGLLSLYTKQAGENGTAAAEFRLGVLAFYLVGEHYQQWSGPGKAQKDALVKTARTSLDKAYRLSHAPVVGFVLAPCYGYTGGGPSTQIYEDVMRHLGGESIYQAYLQAKRNGWSGPLPGVPRLPHDEFQQLRHLVFCLWSPSASIRKVGTLVSVNSQTQSIERIVPNSPEQNRKAAYLGQWRRLLSQEALDANQ